MFMFMSSHVGVLFQNKKEENALSISQCTNIIESVLLVFIPIIYDPIWSNNV